MGQSNPKLVSYAAQDGRLRDLVYHLELSGPSGLKPASGAEKNRTPLHFSAIGGFTECISALYDAGANLNVKDDDGMTALHHAAARGHLYAAQLLLDLGANETLTTRFGITPVHLATSCGHTPMIKILASHGADINVQESWGHTPLMIATQQSRLECMKLLLKMSANTECCDRLHGNTVLHFACNTRDEQTLLVLLDGGCDIKAVNNTGLTPLGVAIDNKFYRAIPLLIEYGAVPNEEDLARCSGGLHNYILGLISSPLPLARAARVALRKALGPSNIEEQLESLEIVEDLQKFVKSVRNDCCSDNEAKTQALLGRTVVTNAATTKF